MEILGKDIIIIQKKWFLKNISKKSVFLYVERSRNVQKNIKPLLIEYEYKYIIPHLQVGSCGKRLETDFMVEIFFIA
jgi:hypothetical protein